MARTSKKYKKTFIQGTVPLTYYEKMRFLDLDGLESSNQFQKCKDAYKVFKTCLFCIEQIDNQFFYFGCYKLKNRIAVQRNAVKRLQPIVGEIRSLYEDLRLDMDLEHSTQPIKPVLPPVQKSIFSRNIICASCHIQIPFSTWRIRCLGCFKTFSKKNKK